jgi:phosphoenolpyruvate carboxylase
VKRAKKYPDPNLPSELKEMVSKSVAVLGHVIQRELGKKGYQQIEAVRREMVKMRGLSSQRATQCLQDLLERLRKLNFREQLDLARSFTLMLELMNANENAFLSVRIRNRPRVDQKSSVKALIYVLTAHPTEARSPQNIQVFHQIQEVLFRGFNSEFASIEGELFHLLQMAWRVSIVRKAPPTVADEANHIYTTVLREEILQVLLRFGQKNNPPVYLRSWVGGDKDGHPKVNEKTLVKSLQLSRNRLIQFALIQVKKIENSLQLWSEEQTAKPLRKMLKELEIQIHQVRKIQSGDGGRITKLRSKVLKFQNQYKKVIGILSPELVQLQQLIHLFPAWVVPLEIRESSKLVMLAGSDPNQAIVRMLKKLKEISEGGNPKWYVRGFIVSMTQSWEHLKNACRLVLHYFGDLKISVIPLFEELGSLQNAPPIISQMLNDPFVKKALRSNWNHYLEIMVGYSDSSKESGVLPSRVAIFHALEKLDRLIRSYSVTPLFFHGSGGSIDRGGGPVQDQISNWPKSALSVYKATVQGEMVERSFSSPEIAESQIQKIVREATDLIEKNRQKVDSMNEVEKFANRIRQKYEEKVGSPEFLKWVEHATPYPYLSVLRLGSRPAKRVRTGEISVFTLRAIPWVLCWTQTRVLFPTWWGVGSSWKQSTPATRKKMIQAFKKNAYFRTYVRTLAFTLAKVELPIWYLYLQRSGFDLVSIQEIFSEFENEYKETVKFVHEVCQSQDLLWDKPWLKTSIYLRSPMIHPLNLLQILAFERNDFELIRLTVTGIASGMLTTG